MKPDPLPRASGAIAADVPKVGDVLAGKYRVESILGAGGMGVVVLVEHVELGQRMAVKLLLPGVTHDQSAVARFVREARAAAALQSEHVVRIFDVGTLDNGAPYMVMELLRGQDLAQTLARSGRLPMESAVEYVIQACHALGEAHALGIVHRDLKPSNLFLARRSDGSPLVKILDFGISKAAGSDSVFSGNLTATSAIMGSPLYMSPEQVRDAKQVDTRADIWSLGVILHELLTGRPAFHAETLPGVCAAIICDDPPPLRTLREDAPEALEQVVTRCLEKDVARRFQTTKELMAALRPFTSSQVGVSMPPGPDVEAGADAGRTGGLSTVLAAPTRRVESGPVAVPRKTGEALTIPAAVPTSISGTLASSTASISHTDSPPPTLSPPGASRTRWALVAGALAMAAVVGFALLPGRTSAPAAAVASAAPPAAAPRRSFQLVVDSQPTGADVMEGDRILGATPMQLSVDNDSVREEPRRLSLRKPGFTPYALVQGSSNDDVRVLATLATAAPAIAPPPPIAAVSAAPPRVVVTPGKSPPATPATAAPPPDIRLQR